MPQSTVQSAVSHRLCILAALLCMCAVLCSACTLQPDSADGEHAEVSSTNVDAGTVETTPSEEELSEKLEKLDAYRAAGDVSEAGYPTLHTLLTFDGEQLTELLELLDYEFSEEMGGWATNDGSSFVGVLDRSGALGEEEVRALPVGDETGSICRLLQLSSYDTAEELMGDVVGETFVDMVFVNDEEVAAAVLSGPDVQNYLILVSPLGVNHFNVAVFSERSIAAGLLDEVAGRSYGESLDEVWQKLADPTQTQTQSYDLSAMLSNGA